MPVQRNTVAVLSSLLLLLLAACGSPAPAPPAPAPAAAACVNAKAAHKAYVVVQHLDGKVTYGCVGFDAAQINGDDFMKQSKIDFHTQKFSFGSAACSIDNEPVQFNECLPKDAPYWGLWVAVGGAAWTMAQTAYDAVILKDGDALGWRYTKLSDANPSPPPTPKK
jgi:hypothetical protein